MDPVPHMLAGEEKILLNLLALGLSSLPMKQYLDASLSSFMQPNSDKQTPRSGAIFLTENATNTLSLQRTASHNTLSCLDKPYDQVAFGECYCGSAAQKNTVIFGKPDKQCPLLSDGLTQTIHHICIPLSQGSRVHGVLLLDSPPERPWQQDEIDFLNLIADVITMGLIKRHNEDDLRQQATTAEEISQQNMALLSRVSHEFRTPLNAIMGFGELLSMENDTLLPHQNEFVGHIMDASQHLLCLVNELLELQNTRSQVANATREVIPVTNALNLAVLATRPVANQAQVRLNLDQPACTWIRANPALLHSALNKLLLNAIAHTGTDNSVTVRSDLLDSGDLQITVNDRRQPVSEQDQKLFFDPLYRNKQTGEFLDHNGLELTMAKLMIESMQGSIAFECSQQGGGQFTVRLPTVSNTGNMVSPPQPRPQYAIVYITHASADAPLFTDKALHQQHNIRFELIPARDTQQAIRLIEQHQPELILLDTNLPDTEPAIINELFSVSQPHTPIAIVDPHAPAGKKFQCFHNCILLPLYGPDFISAVERLLNHRVHH